MRRHKYNAVRAVGDSGRAYDSTAERDRANDLRLLVAAGDIHALEDPAPRILLMPGLYYKPDFGYVDVLLGHVYEDVKGVETERFRVICKVWAQVGPVPLLVTKRQRRHRGFTVTKTIVPQHPELRGVLTEGQGLD